jgi:hypothetical protein
MSFIRQAFTGCYTPGAYVESLLDRFYFVPMLRHKFQDDVLPGVQRTDLNQTSKQLLIQFQTFVLMQISLYNQAL